MGVGESVFKQVLFKGIVWRNGYLTYREAGIKADSGRTYKVRWRTSGSSRTHRSHMARWASLTWISKSL